MKRLLAICAVAAFVTVLGNTAQAVIWHVPGDFATIQEAIDSPFVEAGETIMVGPGEHYGALVTKSVEIKGEEGAVINDGPLHPAGLTYGFRLEMGSDAAIISHLEFDNIDLAIMNGEGVDDVTVESCIFLNAVQAISNWSGSEWQISHNVITDLRTRSGGGIGILIADRSGEVVENNVVSHNKISGTLHVWENDCGGYNGSGIVLYADFRWGGAGAEAIRDNRVVQNKVSMVSDTPGVVDIAAFELTDTRDDSILGPATIFGNAIGFNDFRGTTLQIVVMPASLDDCNEISRNKGDNRGHGSHPSLFGPGGS
ncbi:MAG: right-handed parallel beta-helix repeat-containing protein [Planctomycetota bacterium]|nr:right-handed parallel beta-helix repeat-containing protein [Planctomycetota bacterium]